LFGDHFIQLCLAKGKVAPALLLPHEARILTRAETNIQVQEKCFKVFGKAVLVSFTKNIHHD